jgi:hypothetical protein
MWWSITRWQGERTRDGIDPAGRLRVVSATGVGLGEQTEPPGQTVVVAAPAGALPRYRYCRRQELIVTFSQPLQIASPLLKSWVHVVPLKETGQPRRRVTVSRWGALAMRISSREALCACEDRRMDAARDPLLSRGSARSSMRTGRVAVERLRHIYLCRSREWHACGHATCRSVVRWSTGTPTAGARRLAGAAWVMLPRQGEVRPSQAAEYRGTGQADGLVCLCRVPLVGEVVLQFDVPELVHRADLTQYPALFVRIL